jgi:hypothetical protein
MHMFLLDARIFSLKDIFSLIDVVVLPIYVI